MNKVKISFCLFLLLISFVCFYSGVQDFKLLDFLISKNRATSITEVIANYDFSNPISFLDFDTDKTIIKNDTKSFNDPVKSSDSISIPLVYFYNTHQQEEYLKRNDNSVPTVLDVSRVLKNELYKNGIYSIVEERDIIGETKRRGYDYTGTYEVSFDYLKEQKTKNPTLNYFFDIHRDSVVGDISRTVINNKKYATIMFLVGANYSEYTIRVNNINVMKKYLDKKYPGLVRSTYIQKKYAFNQKYSPNMFLVEIGGPENSIEEVTNSAKALAESIYYYIEVSK